jgi:hypothetical protein
MSKDSLPRILLLVFVITAVAYFAAFFGIERWRARKGPWQVDFAVAADGRPTMLISQSGLRLDGVTIVFAEESAPATNLTIRFDHPIKDVPWGTVAYQDPITYPGVVTLHLFGHEIEMMPRTLSLNRREIPWQSHSTNRLKSADKLPADKLVKRKYQREGK